MRRKEKLIESDQTEEDKCLEELANATTGKSGFLESEPFEAYSLDIQAKIQSQENQFKQRFLKGYHVLIDELHHKQSV